MEARQIKPVHLYRDYGIFYEAIKQAKGDLMPYPFGWQFVKEALKSFDAYCQFLNDNTIENWVFDDGDEVCVRLRFSHFRQAALEAGIAHEGSFHLR